MVTNISWLKPVQDMHSDPRSAYTERLEARRQAVARQDQRHRTIGNLRLLVFLSAAVLAWLAWGRDALSAFCLALPAAVFANVFIAAEGTKAYGLEQFIVPGMHHARLQQVDVLVVHIEEQFVALGIRGAARWKRRRMPRRSPISARCSRQVAMAVRDQSC